MSRRSIRLRASDALAEPARTTSKPPKSARKTVANPLAPIEPSPTGRLPLELFEAVLSACTPSIAAKCLVLSSKVFPIVAKNLMSRPKVLHARYGLRDRDSGIPVVTKDDEWYQTYRLAKNRRKKSSPKQLLHNLDHYVDHLTVEPHGQGFDTGHDWWPSTNRISILHVPMQAARGSISFCTEEVCEYVEKTRPKTIILEGILNLIRALPKGISMSSSDPGVFSCATTLVMLPITIAGHLSFHLIVRDAVWPFGCRWWQDLPETVRDIVIIFDTLPEGHWPEVWPTMHAEAVINTSAQIEVHPHTLDDLLNDLVIIITQTNKATLDAESDASRRQWTFVNTGRLQPELVSGKQLDPGDMEAEFQGRLTEKLNEVYDMEHLGDEGHQTARDVAKRVAFKSMPEFLRRGVGWDLQARRARDLVPVEVLDKWRGME